MDALAWWLIPLGLVLVAFGVVALIGYLRRPTEDHDLGQYASLREAMSRTQHGPRPGPRSAPRSGQSPRSRDTR